MLQQCFNTLMPSENRRCHTHLNKSAAKSMNEWPLSMNDLLLPPDIKTKINFC